LPIDIEIWILVLWLAQERGLHCRRLLVIAVRLSMPPVGVSI